MKESEIIAAVKGYLKSVDNCFFWKEHGAQFGQAGIPDIIVCLEGRFVAFEVKAEKGRTTILQEVTLRRIRNAGGTAEVVRSVKEVKAIISQLQGGQNGKA